MRPAQNFDDGAYSDQRPRRSRKSSGNPGGSSLISETPSSYSAASSIMIQQVTAADGGECLVTRLKRHYEVRLAHLLPQAAGHDQEALDWCATAWGARPGSVQVNHWRNLLHLNPGVHVPFDAGDSALVPTIPELEKILAVLTENSKSNWLEIYPDEGPYCEFMFLSLEPTFLHRKEPTGDVKIPELGPFGPLRHHAHPYCAILNAAPKLARFHPQAGHEAYWVLVEKIVEIWVDNNGGKGVPDVMLAMLTAGTKPIKPSDLAMELMEDGSDADPEEMSESGERYSIDLWRRDVKAAVDRHGDSE